MTRSLHKLFLIAAGAVGVAVMAPAAANAQTVHLDDDFSGMSAPDSLGQGFWSASRGTHPENWAVWDADPDGTPNKSLWSKGANFVRTYMDGWAGPLAATPSTSAPLIFQFDLYDFMEDGENVYSYGEIRKIHGDASWKATIFAAGVFEDGNTHYRVRAYPTQNWVTLTTPRSEGWHTFTIVIRGDTFDAYVDQDPYDPEAVPDPNATNLSWKPHTSLGNNELAFDQFHVGGAISTPHAFLYDNAYLANDPELAPAVEIIEQPTAAHPAKGAVRAFGESVTFNVVAQGGAEPLSYQWQRDGEPLSDDARISGSQTDTLTITNLDGPDSGQYNVVITDADGNSVTSIAATLWAMREHEVIMNAMDLPAEAVQPDGGWTPSAGSGWFGAYYAGQVPPEEPERTVTFQPEITQAGHYDVFTWFQPSTPGGNRTEEAAYKVQHADGENTVFINQEVEGGKEFWHYVGTYRFDLGSTGSVVISNHLLGPGGADASGLVFADAVRFVPAEAPPVEGVLPSVSIARGAGSDVELFLTGEPNATHVVEVSDDLVTWTELGDPVTLNSEGVGEKIDSNATASSRRFYRVRE